jgi:hypothetical protein
MEYDDLADCRYAHAACGGDKMTQIWFSESIKALQ